MVHQFRFKPEYLRMFIVLYNWIFSLIILMPITTFILLLFCGVLVGTRGSLLFSCFNIFISLFFSVILFLNVSSTKIFYWELWNWMTINNFELSFSFRYDALTAVMFLVVTLVSFCVHVYSCVYMYTDPHLTRFMSYLSLFTFFMLVLVSSANLIVLFLGW